MSCWEELQTIQRITCQCERLRTLQNPKGGPCCIRQWTKIQRERINQYIEGFLATNKTATTHFLTVSHCASLAFLRAADETFTNGMGVGQHVADFSSSVMRDTVCSTLFNDSSTSTKLKQGQGQSFWDRCQRRRAHDLVMHKETSEYYQLFSSGWFTYQAKLPPA